MKKLWLSMGLVCLWWTNVAPASELQPPSLSVRGEATLLNAADVASFTIGVMNTAAQAQTALEENNRLMAKLQKALRKAGVKDKQMSSQAFSVQPQFDARPRTAAPDWKPTIKGYHARAQLLIETDALDQLAGYIQTGIDAGANQVSQLRFGLKHDQAANQQAIAQATQQAAALAKAAAEAAGVKLDGIQHIQVNAAAAKAFTARAASMARMEADSMGSKPVVNPAEIKVRASVNLIYRIR